MKNPQIPATEHRPAPYSGPGFDEVLELRRRYLSPGLITFYKRPLMLVEGHLQYVYDEKGRRYLDGFGGIATIGVGHCHPHVVDAVRRQVETLQHTTTIYLHATICEYAERLAAKLPEELNVCYFVNSGSEANDTAMLMARLYTGNYDIIALRNAYHGGIASAMSLTAHSTWKFNYPHSYGVHHALNPDPYRGPWGRDDAQAGAKYAAEVQDIIDHATPGRIAAFFAESIQGVGGVVVYPDGYLRETYERVRAAGGLCIADEVQTGFGRTGTHYWGFAREGVVPDIVTMAKSIGNGVPLAAVMTRPEIAETLARRVYFNTYAGNPVSCAAGKAVLEVIDRERLQENALAIGGRVLDGLRTLAEKHELIGDVRGSGLMLGVDLVRDRAAKTPAGEECAQVLERCKELGLLLGKGGLRGNVLRIKPPLCVSAEDGEFIIEVLDHALSEL